MAELSRVERELATAEAIAQAEAKSAVDFGEVADETSEPAPDVGEAVPADPSAIPAVTLFGPVPVESTARRWLAGQDVQHAQRGQGWVQGAGVGRVTVRFEGPGTEPGRIGTFRADDPDLEPLDAADVAREALRLLESVQSTSARPE